MLFQALLFNECILHVEGDEITAIETIRHVQNLENTLSRRRNDVFLTTRTETEKSKLIGTGVGRATLEGVCKQFFGMHFFFSGSLENV